MDSTKSTDYLDAMGCVDSFDFIDSVVSMDPWIPKSPCIMSCVYGFHGSHGIIHSFQWLRSIRWCFKVTQEYMGSTQTVETM